MPSVGRTGDEKLAYCFFDSALLGCFSKGDDDGNENGNVISKM